MRYLALKPYLDTLVHVSQTRSFPLYLRTSIQSIHDLRNLITAALEDADDDGFEAQHRRSEIWLKSFDVHTVLNAELSIQPTYMVFPKRAYDIETLIADGTQLFSEECRQEFSDEEKYDLNQATKCLVFEVPTAAAFHIFRAVESVIRRYYQVVVGTLPATKSRNWSVYTKKLKGSGVDIKITAVLDEMRELYRNPIIHPETAIGIDEALSLLGIAETAISTILADVKKRRAAAEIATIASAFARATD